MGIDSEVISTHLEVEHKIGIKFPREMVESKENKKPRKESQETIILGGVAERGEKGNMKSRKTSYCPFFCEHTERTFATLRMIITIPWAFFFCSKFFID